MQEQTIRGYLDELGSSAPAPGGGAVAAFSAAQAAALVEMVGHLSVGRGEENPSEVLAGAIDQARLLRAEALSLAADDAAAFSAVIAAYRMPKADAAAREAAIQHALLGAAEVPLRTAAAAAAVIELAERIRPEANRNVLSDVAVAATTARAAIEASAVNVQVNAVGLADPAARRGLEQRFAPFRLAAVHAERLLLSVEEQLGQ